MDIKVSVVITAYNIERYVLECVESVLQQTLHAIEVICVDDCSCDKTGGILDALAVEDDRMIVIHNSVNQGLSDSRVIGFRRAKGEYLYIMDGDDMLEPNALERLYSVAVENKLDLLSFSGSVFFDEDSIKDKYGNKSDVYKRKGEYNRVGSVGGILEK